MVIVPPSKSTAEAHSGGFAIDVRRTVSSVKTYSDLNIEIHTGHPTGITWATSYQPAIQDMMMVIETFTKPQLDPSERPGFWDKIRLSFHSRANISWTGDGDVHLMLKGMCSLCSVSRIGLLLMQLESQAPEIPTLSLATVLGL